MNRVWLKILAAMIFGNILKYAFVNVVVWVIIDLSVLLICYLILKRQPFINLKHSLIFLGGLTAVSVLMDTGVLNAIAGNLILLALIGWMIYGSGFKSNNYTAPRKKYHK